MRSGPSEFNQSLESLRGLAALAVVITHSLAVLKIDGLASFWLVPLSTQTPAAKTLTVISAFANASAAVVIFFMLSGYVLALSIARADNLTMPERLRAYAIRRAFRLLPPMWCSILLFWGVTHSIAIADPALRASSAVAAWFAPPSLTDVAQNFVLVQFGANPVTWTMYVEVIGSFSIVAMVAITRRSLVAAMASLAGLTILTVLSWPSLTFSYLFAFQFGVILAFCPTRYRLGPKALLCAGLSICFVQHLRLADSAENLLLTGAGCALILASVLRASQTGGFPTLQLAALRHLGRVSYSLYLFHLPVLYAATAVVLRFWRGPADILPSLLLAASVSILSIAVASLAYLWIERPALSLGRYISRNLTRQSVPLATRAVVDLPPERSSTVN